MATTLGYMYHSDLDQESHCCVSTPSFGGQNFTLFSYA